MFAAGIVELVGSNEQCQQRVRSSQSGEKHNQADDDVDKATKTTAGEGDSRIKQRIV